MPHAGCGGAGLPALEEARTGIEDAKPPRRNAGVPDKARGDVHAVDSPANDEPSKHLYTTIDFCDDIL